MKFLPWILAGSLLLIARAIAAAIPSTGDLPLIAEGLKRLGIEWQDDKSAAQPNSPLARQNDSGLIGKDCQAAGPAVVTIHAGRAFGSGSIVKPEGLVITNNHVVRPARDGQIGVKLISGKQYQGRVIAVDQQNDLALVKLDTQDRLPSVSLGNTNTVQIGQSVCAIGSPFARPGVLTRGTLTTVRRNGDLQSALELQPGNSGGPLLNQRGEMIGVNKAIWQSRSGVNSGISFATNIATAKNFIEQNASGGSLFSARPTPQQPDSLQPSYGDSYPVPSYPMDRPPMMPPESHPVPTEPFESGAPPPSGAPQGVRLGVVINDEMQIQSVENGSVAATVGIQAGDRLVALDGIQIQGIDQLHEFLSQRPSSVVITVNREDQLKNIRVSF